MEKKIREEMPEQSWYEVCLVVPGTDGDAENGPCEPQSWKYMVRATSETEAARIANDKEIKDWKSPMVDEEGIEIGPSNEDIGLECPVCTCVKKVTDEEYQAWEREMEALPFE